MNGITVEVGIPSFRVEDNSVHAMSRYVFVKMWNWILPIMAGAGVVTSEGFSMIFWIVVAFIPLFIVIREGD